MIHPDILRDRESLEHHSRSLYQTAYLGPGTVLCRVLGRYLVYADPQDEDITPHLCLDGFWESWITLAIARRLKPGMFCVDVGANHGYYSLLMADASGEDGRVLAMEPNPVLARLIRLSAKANGLDRRIQVIEKAAAETSGMPVTLTYPQGHAGNASICGQSESSDCVVPADTLSIDDAVSEWPRVDLMKIDAEGAEPAIWEGMSETLDNNPGLTIFLEFTPGVYRDAAGFLARMTDCGFIPRLVDADGRIQAVSPDVVLRPDCEPGWWMLCLTRS